MSQTRTEPITLTIDGREVRSSVGRTVLEVCRDRGVYVPTLCNDPRLEAFGACRLCIVEIEGMRGFPPSCAVPATDGMVVTTKSPVLDEIRRTIVELLLSDHPLDCLTCESSGSCELQEVAYRLQVSRSPFEGERRVLEIADDNPVIARDMNKCIQCGRCIRICEEVQGVRVYGWVGRGFDVSAATPFGRPLSATDCEFCGQCVSTCPTGALTERMSRFRGRHWECTETRTTCGYCGVGCTVSLRVSDGVVVGASAPIGEGVNGGNLCLKGRFGYDFVNHPERLTTPLVRRDGELEEATWDEALSLVAERLGAIRDESGSSAIAGLASAKCTNEENYLFQKLMRAGLGTNNVDHCARL